MEESNFSSSPKNIHNDSSQNSSGFLGHEDNLLPHFDNSRDFKSEISQSDEDEQPPKPLKQQPSFTLGRNSHFLHDILDIKTKNNNAEEGAENYDGHEVINNNLINNMYNPTLHQFALNNTA